jgi:hypothetical protein
MSAISLADYQLFHTGSGSNATLTSDIGGAISSVRVLNQSVTGLTLCTGIVCDDASGNSPGQGLLSFTASGTLATWSPYGGSAGTSVNIGADGRYTLQGAGTGAGCLFITVSAASLPGSDTSDTITVANRLNTMFADVSKSQSLAGLTVYHCFAVKNMHASDSMVNVLEWIAANTPGQDHITIGLDPVVAGNGATGVPAVLANENTAPAGVVFVNPSSIGDANVLSLGTLTYGQVRFIWYKLAVPAGVTAASPTNTFNRGYSITA